MKIKQATGNLTVSVAMSVHNGEKYIRDQLNSILFQLQDYDELIISYTPSSDGTFRILNQYEKNDHRIHIINNNKSDSYNRNINRMLTRCSGDIIFLAEHDNIWFDNKIEKVLDAFNRQKNITTVIHNSSAVDNHLNPIGKTSFKTNHTNHYFVSNVLKNSYKGSCMAFSANMRDIVCPIPPEITAYGMWIGIISNIFGKVSLLKEVLMIERRPSTKINNHYNRISLLKYIKKKKKAIKSRRNVVNMKRRRRSAFYPHENYEYHQEIS